MEEKKNYFSLGILFFINLLNYCDRLTVASVLIHIQEYYNLSNSDTGLIQTSFIVSYLIFAPIFGYLGDRYSRKYIIVFGITFWSGTTLLSSFVDRNYVWLFYTLRALIGVGEASYSTIAPTIIADLFRRKIRTRMLVVFYFATPIGSGLGYMIGSTMNQLFNDWKWAFRVTPPLGILAVILLVLFVKEPTRGSSDNITNLEKTSIKADLLYLTTVKSYMWTLVAYTCVIFSVGALSWWEPTYIEYAYKVSGDTTGIDLIGILFGGIICFAGIFGVILGSGTAQCLRKKYPKIDPIICGVGILATIPFAYAKVAIVDMYRILTWIFLFISLVLLSTNCAIVVDMLLYVIVPNKRATAQAIQITIAHLLGDATSPYIIGLLSDLFRGSDESIESQYKSLQFALYLALLPLIPAGLSFLYCALHIEKDEKNVEKLKDNSNSSKNDEDSNAS